MTQSAAASPIPSGFFVWRTPAFPFDELLAWGDGLRAPACEEDGESLAKAIRDDREVLRERLRKALGRAAVREALFLASPSLDERTSVWRDDPAGATGRDVECALVRYYERMAARPTPFGLFSGCSRGTVGDRTSLDLEDSRTWRRHSRLDMDYLAALVAKLQSLPEFRRQLTCRPNSSLYRAAGRFRYAEGRLNGGGRSWHLVAVDAVDYLERALDRARSGATLAEIAEAICRLEPDVTQEEAEAYVGELIDAQVLVPDLALAVTGPEPIGPLVAELRRHAAGQAPACVLDEARTALSALDDAGPGIDRERYVRIAQTLEALPAPVELPRLFQVDLIKPSAGATLGQEPLEEILRGVEILRRLAPPAQEDDLDRFRDAFVSRYEGREVELVEALDEEIGIGFGSRDRVRGNAAPLLEHVGLQPGRGRDETPGRWLRVQSVQMEKLLQAATGGATEIELTDRDIERMSAPRPRALPTAFSISAILAARSQADLASGDFRIQVGGGAGPSGARLLGRFCHADESLREEVERHLRAEERHAPDAVFAEVVHLPEGRLGNILFRPVLRSHEIPLLGGSGAPPDRQIPVTDLMVSVVSGRIVLRSKRLDREIVPRLTSAHNYSHRSLPLYRFLCSLQSQGAASWLQWSWGPLQNAAFLPRVRMGRLILARARWTVSGEELAALAKEAPADRFLRARRWRKARKMPRFVLLSDADNELLVDLDNSLSIDAFVDVAGSRSSATLTEMFPQPEELVARGPEGAFVHEMIVPFVLPAPDAGARPAVTPRSAGETSQAESAPARSFPPGSEWLYANIYAGASTADRILTDEVGPLVRRLMESGAADRWFFIRYSDPDWHLRVRLHGPPARLASEALPALHAALEPTRAEGRLWRVQIDTYEREVERYGGGPGMEVSEEFFHADSDAVLEIAGMLAGDEGADARWRLTLCGVDRLLGDFGFDLDRRLAFARSRSEAFALEFGADKALRIRLGSRYRVERKSLEELLRAAARDPGEHELAPALRALRDRSDRLAPSIAQLRGLAESGRLAVPFEDLAMHYTHMFVNRLLLSNHRAQELVLWDFLARTCESLAARAKQTRSRAGAAAAPLLQASTQR